MQRARIPHAMAEIVAEHGYPRTKVKLVIARAGVSTRTFYEYFENLEGCFMALLDLGSERARELIIDAFEREDRWQDGARTAHLPNAGCPHSALGNRPPIARVRDVTGHNS